MAFEFVGQLPDDEAMQKLADDLAAMSDHRQPIDSVHGGKTVGELIEDLRQGKQAGLQFLANRRRAEAALSGFTNGALPRTETENARDERHEICSAVRLALQMLLSLLPYKRKS